MKSDLQLKIDVTQELEWDAAINATHIGVSVKDGVVTLSGHLDTFAEKHAAEHAVQRVQGVKAVAIELDVKIAPGHQRSDTEIARAVEHALNWHALVPAERVHVKVEKGWVTLGGEVDWDCQRVAVVNAVRPLLGVVGVDNLMTLKSLATPANVSQRIRDALTRHAQREARDINVTVSGATVMLGGHVDTWAEHAAAQGAAWSAPGVTAVINSLVVNPT